MTWILIGFLIFLAMAAFCSAAEIIIITVNPIKLQHQKEEGLASVGPILELLRQPDVLISAILVGNNLAHVSCSALATLYFTRLLGEHPLLSTHIPMITSVTVTPVILVLGEIVPKNIGRRFANTLIYYIYHPVRIFIVVFRPVLWFITTCTHVFTRFITTKSEEELSSVSREEFVHSIRKSVHFGAVDTETERMIQSTFDFRKTLAKEVMVPLMEVRALSIRSTTVSHLIRMAREYHHTRYPVYEDRIDRITGYVNIYEVFEKNVNENQLIRDFVRPVSYVPNTIPIDKLLIQMKRSYAPMVIAVDEYGGCDGLVTFEDIIEELVGEIVEEHEDHVPEIVLSSENEYIVDASIDLDDLNEELKLFLPKHSCETLAGYLMTMFERIPNIGDCFVVENLCFEILERDGLAITTVKISLL